MNLITDTFRGLVQRKLWPVALALVCALVAVPVLLTKAPVAAPASSPNTKKTEALPATFVSAAEGTEITEDAEERRRVLGDLKDPFEPAPLKKVKKKKQAASEKTEKTEKAEPADEPKTETKTGGDPSGGAGGGGVPPVAPAPTPTATVPQYSIKVRFGAVAESGDLESKTVERLTVLPDEEAPVLIYRGVEDGGKVAVFEITGVVDAQGDGKCEPTPEECQYLKLRAGETEFITITETGTEADAQYQLDLVKIYKKDTKVAKSELEDEAEALAKAASASLGTKRDRYVFNEKTGTLRRKGK
jgi:hypothetical protein